MPSLEQIEDSFETIKTSLKLTFSIYESGIFKLNSVEVETKDNVTEKIEITNEEGDIKLRKKQDCKIPTNHELKNVSLSRTRLSPES